MLSSYDRNLSGCASAPRFVAFFRGNRSVRCLFRPKVPSLLEIQPPRIPLRPLHTRQFSDMKQTRHSASTNGHSQPVANGNGHAVAPDAATINALLARIDELESRLRKLEGDSAPAQAHDKNGKKEPNNIPVVIISAVVASVLQKPHRIHSIDPQMASPWALHGRMQLQQLHQARL
ncbi:MAG TPA: hypothetical protein PLV33_10255 [Opitutaceae bacterium]|nr:hypothetical protein [Opitutaceae bacterium]HQL22314.1 hypothetical protein [Opitutaceae bacterium]